MNRQILATSLDQPLVLDGAMGTELEKLGVATNDELWSANALIDQQEKIYQVHASYFQAGADLAITDTYQANVAAFAKRGIGHQQALDLLATGVHLAQAARDRYRPTGLVAGCIGPYGAYLADGSEYTGNYTKTVTEYEQFHREKILTLIDAGADLLSVDTMPNFQEIQAVVGILATLDQPIPYWISLSVRNQRQLSDGTDLNRVVAWLRQQPSVGGIGINCTKMENITPLVKLIRAQTKLPIIVYPNPGDLYDPLTKTWTTVPHVDSFTKEVPHWLAAGANIIGGCCRTTPADIAQISRLIRPSV
ncbi:homocysteine S-methyltransferase [Fructilactobacillus florum]|uniref:homocysteine S-methyltransferase n=1 Tax=Fructilactobacillus florum TaxID=640331 RepID=UPI00028EA6B5|nr:homocysteine S-methyltransferase [Fructilactobacillus florum]EKK20736.1 Homocysteine S-methyltransferase [Fructilactobacillus florum 2F]